MRSTNKKVLAFLRQKARKGLLTGRWEDYSKSPIDIINQCIGTYLDPTFALRISKINPSPIRGRRMSLVAGTLVVVIETGEVGFTTSTARRANSTAITVENLISGARASYTWDELAIASLIDIENRIDQEMMVYSGTGRAIGKLLPDKYATEYRHSAQSLKIGLKWYTLYLTDGLRLTVHRTYLLKEVAKGLERSVGAYVYTLSEMLKQPSSVELGSVVLRIQDALAQATTKMPILIDTRSYLLPALIIPWPYKITYIRKYGGEKYKLPDKYALSDPNTCMAFTLGYKESKNMFELSPKDFCKWNTQSGMYSQFIHYHSFSTRMCLGSVDILEIPVATTREELARRIQVYIGRLKVAVSGVNLGSPALSKPREAWPSISDLADSIEGDNACVPFVANTKGA